MSRHKITARITPRSELAPTPKVTAATGGSALGVVLAWLVTLVPGLDHAPAEVQAAVVVLVIAAVTFAAGWLKSDRRRA